jgi:SAM-dependent methyltransferase
MPVDEDAAAGRETYWASQTGYHEHRAPEEQDVGAQEFSQRFVREWLLPLGGSFLELGCGAGRNLAELRRQAQDVELSGIDVNAGALEVARRSVAGGAFSVGSLYDLGEVPDRSVDVVFTTGVLMHVPHERVDAVVQEMLRIARVAVVHSELHGQPREYDFHRYPRDYGAVYGALDLDVRYVVEPQDDGTGGERGLLAARV